MKIECHDLAPKIARARGDIFRHGSCRKMSPSIVMIWCPKVPVGDAAPQALRGLRGGWRSPRRRLRAHGPGRAGVVLHPELQNRVRLLPVAQPQTYLATHCKCESKW